MESFRRITAQKVSVDLIVLDRVLDNDEDSKSMVKDEKKRRGRRWGEGEIVKGHVGQMR